MTRTAGVARGLSLINRSIAVDQMGPMQEQLAEYLCKKTGPAKIQNTEKAGRGERGREAVRHQNSR